MTKTEKHLFIVFTNPVEGREDEFDDWYDNRHLEDVLKVPGIVAAQRYKPSPVQRMELPLPWTRFAIYEIETDDLKQTMDALASRSGTDAMPLSDSLHEIRQAFVVQPLGERRTR